MSTYLQDGWDVYNIEIKSWNQVEFGMKTFAVFFAAFGVLFTVYMMKQYPAIFPAYTIGAVLVAAVVLGKLLEKALRMGSLILAVYKFRKSDGFSYSRLSQCDSFQGWFFYKWRHEIKPAGATCRLDHKAHYGFRILGVEVLIGGSGGWHRSNTWNALPYHGT